MTRKYKKEVISSGKVILLVDDDNNYLDSARHLLEREGHKVLTCSGGREALKTLKNHHIDLLLLDFFMPGMTGEAVVSELRKFNPLVQVILQTGYASEKPPRQMLHELDIQGYYDKSNGPEQLLLWTDIGLKTAHAIQGLTKSREGLRYILEITPELHKIQPINSLLQGILWQVTGLLGVVSSFLVALPENEIPSGDNDATNGFVALQSDDRGLQIHAATGQFESHQKIEDLLNSEIARSIQEAYRQGKITQIDEATIVPLTVGDTVLGVLYLDRPVFLEEDLRLLQIFANQAAVAIQNIQLYELAAMDGLTGVYARGFLDKLLVRELQRAYRTQQPISFALLDMDNLKLINDRGGHLAGDTALKTLGTELRNSLRMTDVIGRYGGDEFLLLLPNTNHAGAVKASERIYRHMENMRVAVRGDLLPIGFSIGLCTLNQPTFDVTESSGHLSKGYFRNLAEILIKKADSALYQAKSIGRNQMISEGEIEWNPIHE